MTRVAERNSQLRQPTQRRSVTERARAPSGCGAPAGKHSNAQIPGRIEVRFEVRGIDLAHREMDYLVTQSTKICGALVDEILGPRIPERDGTGLATQGGTVSSLLRLRHLAIAPVLIIALGCSSTSSSVPEQTEPQPTPVSDTKDSRADISTVSAKLEPVYFDTAVAELGMEAVNTLRGYAKSILDHPEWGVLRIEGHCDERGSDEYNLALGKRRAAAVKRRLIEMGVAPSRLATRTFGEQKPAVRGHDERAWRQNRRSELRVEDVLASIAP